MNREEEKLVEDLLERKNTIQIREEFQKDLEEKLVQRFTRKSKLKLLVPSFAFMSVSFLLFLLIISSDLFPDRQEAMTINKEPEVYILHTHSTESFLPELDKSADEKNSSYAFDDYINITLIGKHLSEQLEKKGVNVLFDDTNFTKKLLSEGQEYKHSYEQSRINIEENLTKHDSIQMIFDIHRDAFKRDITTGEVHGEDVARIMFIVSAAQSDYTDNGNLAVQLHEELEKRHPGISRGVVAKGGSNTYNQDLSKALLLIEIGGVENTLEEVMRAADYFAEVVAEVLAKHN